INTCTSRDEAVINVQGRICNRVGQHDVIPAIGNKVDSRAEVRRGSASIGRGLKAEGRTVFAESQAPGSLRAYLNEAGLMHTRAPASSASAPVRAEAHGKGTILEIDVSRTAGLDVAIREAGDDWVVNLHGGSNNSLHRQKIGRGDGGLTRVAKEGWRGK